MAIVVNVVGNYSQGDLKKAYADLAQLKAGATEASSAATSGFDRAGTKMESFGDKTAGVGKKMSVGVTAPLGLLAWASLKTSGDFEQSMNQMQVAADVPAPEMKSLSELAMQMGADTVFSAGEAADAMLELAKAGITPAEIKAGALKATMALAATEGLGLSDAATIASNAMSVFHIKAGDAASVADALAGGSMASTASVSSLSQALAQVGPGATQAGLSLNETVGALAAFDQAGIKGSDAGTSLKTFLTRLVPATKAAGDSMSALGLKFTDAKGNILPLTNIAEQLHTKLRGLSDEQRSAALQTQFGSDATRAATILMNEGSAGLAKYIDATKKQGSAQQMADARMKGWNGTLEQTTGSLDTMKTKIGQDLEPTATSLANGVKGLADGFVGLDAGTRKAIVGFGLVLAAIGPTLWIVGKLTSAVGRSFGALKTFGSGVRGGVQALGRFRDGFRSTEAASSAFSGRMGSLGGVTRKAFAGMSSGARTAGSAMGSALRSGAAAAATMARDAGRAGVAMLATGARAVASAAQLVIAKTATLAMSAASKAWAAAQWVLNAALTANPIGLVIAAIALLVGAFVLAYTKVGWFRAGVQAAFSAIQAVISTVLGVVSTIIGTYFEVYKTIFTTAFGVLSGIVTGAWSAIQGTFSAVLGAIRAVLGTYFGIYKTIFTTAWGVISGIVTGVWSGIRTAVSNGLGAVKSVVDTVTGRIRTAWESVWNGMSSFVGGVLGGIVRAAKAPLNGLISLINGLIGAVNRIHVKIPDFPGVPGRGTEIGFALPSIPMLSAGGVATRSGTVMVGEKGPEFLDLPRGAAVRPLDTAARGRGGVTIENISIDARGASDPNGVEVAVRRALDAFTIELAGHLA